MNQPEHPRARTTSVHSPNGNLWRLLPPAAALFYPLAVKALYESGKLLHREGGSGGAVAWLAIGVSVGLVYGVPAVGMRVAYLLGKDQTTSSSELLARRLAQIAIGAPPLFVLVRVVCFLLNSPNADSVVWPILWLTILAAAAWSISRDGVDTPAFTTPAPIPLRVIHGSTALLIVLIFLGWHLLNHASAAFSPEFNQAMM